MVTIGKAYWVSGGWVVGKAGDKRSLFSGDVVCNLAADCGAYKIAQNPVILLDPAVTLHDRPGLKQYSQSCC